MPSERVSVGDQSGGDGGAELARAGVCAVTDELEQSLEKREGSKRGGVRPNSGPKPYGERYKRQIAKTAEIMGKALPEAAQATVDLAKGAYYLMVWNGRTKQYEKPRDQRIADSCVEIGGDMIRVYRELPSIKAIEVIFDRLMGKVPQPVDITIRQAIAEVTEVQALLVRVIEEHVPSEYLTPIREELDRVAEHHSHARTAVGLD